MATHNLTQPYFSRHWQRICRQLAVLAGGLLLVAHSWAGAGAETYNELLEKELIYPDEAWQDYVTEIGERLLEVSPHKGRTYTFTVTDQPEVNAFATPDAYVFVTRGILAHFNSEDELAAVIGHEIGHVVGNHGRRKVGKLRMGEILGWIGSFATGSSAVYGLSNTLTQTAIAGYGRAYELEADEYGFEFIARAGYNPRAMLDSIQMLRDNDNFQRVVNNRPAFYHGILGSHPAHQKRLHELVQSSQHLFPDELREPERDFHAMLDGLRYGNDAATGVVKDGVYYHGGLRLAVQFPKDWTVRATAAEVFGNTPQGADKATIGVKRQSPPDEEQTPLEYLTETLRRDDLEDGKEIQVGPYQGYIASVKIVSGNAQLRKIAVIYKDGGVFLFNGELGDKGDPQAFERQFEETVGSFRAMTAADQRLINNQKIRIVEARPGQTYADLAQNVPLKTHGEETLRMLNGHHPRGEPRAGDRIKIIQ
ncbi:MAG: M48 family metalloprotease [Pseudomonadota bacterium]